MKYDRAIEAAAEAMGIPPDQIATDLIDGIHAAAPFLKADAWGEGYEAGRSDGWHDTRDHTPNPYRDDA